MLLIIFNGGEGCLWFPRKTLVKLTLLQLSLWLLRLMMIDAGMLRSKHKMLLVRPPSVGASAHALNSP